LSPFPLSIYINSVTTALKNADLGCPIDNMFVGYIAYTHTHTHVLVTAISVILEQYSTC